jgi:hypothetical protein
MGNVRDDSIWTKVENSSFHLRNVAISQPEIGEKSDDSHQRVETEDVRLKRSNQAGSLETLGKVAFETVTRPSEMKLEGLD